MSAPKDHLPNRVDSPEHHEDTPGNASVPGRPEPDGQTPSHDEHYFPEDDRSPLEHEDDHSDTDFDLHAELDNRLGASGGPALAERAPLAIVPDDGGHAHYFPEDDHSPAEHEDDHSYTDFDLHQAIESAAQAAGAVQAVHADDHAHVHDDDHAPLDHEDDHSSTDFDLNAEIESRLGPVEDDPLAASREAGKTWLELTQEREPILDPAARAAAARNVDAIGVDDDSRSLPDHETDTDEDGHGLVMHPQPSVLNEENEAGRRPAAEEDALAKPEEKGLVSDEEDEEDGDGDDDEEVTEEDKDDHPMTLRDHLNELRKRLLRAFLFALAGFFVCWPFAETHIFPFLFEPLVHVMPEGSKLIFTSPPEAFFTYLKIAFVSGIFVTCPFVFYQVWAFIAPGLYKEEKFYILPIAVFSAVFFTCGGAFCYYVVFDFIFSFFMSYNQGAVQAMPKLNETLSFVLQLLLAFGLVFELPLFVFFLARLGIITAERLRKFRRYAVLVAVIVGAILTPPDVVSQLLMAGPLIVLYEFSILIAAAFGRKKETPPPDAEEDNEEDESGATP